jgi:hypothetical protein
MKNKENFFKILVCVSGSESSCGAIRYIIQKIKKHNVEIELFSVVEKSGVLRMFMGFGRDQDDLTELNDMRKNLEKISKQIFSETGYRPKFNVFTGDLTEGLKAKILEDSSICLVVFGARNDSWNGKKLPNLMKKFFEFSTIPLLIIPQNITDIQIDNLILNS